MNKFKAYIIPFSIVVIALLITSQVFIALFGKSVNTNSYLELIEGTASLNNERLVQNSQQQIVAGDTIMTYENSLAVIAWGDGSLTRLGSNTKVVIQQEDISKDFTEINISFDLLSGKTWSQVISFLGKDSSFKQSFSGIEAGVRGTVFDVDLDNNFVRANDHTVSLTNTNGESLDLLEGQVLDIRKFSLVAIAEFIQNMEDKAWSTLNEGLDSEYVSILQSALSDEIDNNPFFNFILDFISPKYRIIRSLNAGASYEEISKLIEKVPENKKEHVYNAVLSKYQKMNFVDVKDYEFYKTKILYKKALIDLAPSDQDIQQLVQSSSFDLQDIAEQKLSEGLEETLKLIDSASSLIPESDFTLPELNFNYLPQDLQGALEGIEFNSFQFSNFSDISTIGSSLGEGVKNLEGGVHNFLDSTVGELLKNMNK